MSVEEGLQVGHSTTGGAERRTATASITIAAGGKGWQRGAIICLAESREPRLQADAIRAAKAFTRGAEAAGDATPEEQLRAGLTAADKALTQDTNEANVSIAAARLHPGGITYLGIGSGTVAAWDAETAVMLRAAPEAEDSPHGRGLAGNGVGPGRIDAGSYLGGRQGSDTVVLGTGLLSTLDRETLKWCRSMELTAKESARWIADQVQDRTRDRRPGAHVVVACIQ